MKTRNILLSILMLAIGFNAFAQTNLVQNGDMEMQGDGDSHTFANWSGNASNIRQETTHFIGDARSVRLTGVTTKVSINQTVAVEAGATYFLTFSGRIMDAVGASGSAANTNHTLNAFIFNANADPQWQAVASITSNTDTTVTGSYVVPAGETSVNIVIDKNNGIAYIDDVILVKDTRLLPNSDFEVASLADLATAGWIGTGSNMALEGDAANVINGDKCIRMTGVSAWSYLSYDVEVEAGATYALSCTGRIGAAGGASGSAQATDGFLKGRIRAGTTSGDWTELFSTQSTTDIALSNTYTVPAGITEIRVQVYKDKGIAYVDDMELVKTTVTALESNTTVNGLKAYSPYTGTVKLVADEAISNYAIFSIDGKLIKRAQTNAKEITINCNEKGIYIVRATVNGSLYTQKVLVK